MSVLIFNGSTYSDIESANDNNSTESADEGDKAYEIPDDETCFGDDVDVPSVLEHVEATIPIISYGPHYKLSRGDEVLAGKEEHEMVQDTKFVCALSLLLAVFKSRCQMPGCTAVPTVKYHFVGMSLLLTATYTSGHINKFCSSNEINNIYVNNFQTAASIVVSGTHYAKVKRLAKILNLEFLSKCSYYRFQRLYVIPEINDWWYWIRIEILREFSCQDVVGGDGQCDSPGFNAKNLCYFLVEVNSNYILDIEVLDKRHVGLISTNMEKETVKKSLDRLQKDVKVIELVTDASTTIKSLLGKLMIQ